jgi:hypothetical protein
MLPYSLPAYVVTVETGETPAYRRMSMSMIAVGPLLRLFNTRTPMDSKIKVILEVVVVNCVAVWLPRAFGMLGLQGGIPAP